MQALIKDHLVIQLSETNFDVVSPLFWVEITTEHGAVQSGMIYDQTDDEFRNPFTAYAINTDTHSDYLHESPDDLPSTHTNLVRGEFDSWNSTTEQWEEDPTKVSSDLVTAKNDKVSEFSDLCGARIKAGFTNDALGSDNAYRCNRDDQESMRVASSRTGGGKIWVGEVYTPHTQTEAQEVYDAAIAHIDLLKTEYSAKYAEIQAATTRVAVEAITWPDPT